MPIGPTTARSSSASPRGRRTAAWHASIPTSSGWGSGSRRTSTPRTMSATSPSGRARSRASHPGTTSIGAGRPGWHIECSAMSMKALGPSFDIHTGGIDLIFPHHEDEIAQSEAATGEPFVGTWLHCAHLQMSGSKMAKSTGNIARVGDLLAAGVSARALRYTLIAVHYRASLNYTDDSLRPRRPRDRPAGCRPGGACPRTARSGRTTRSCRPCSTAAREAFGAALDDDLNVSAGLAAVFDLVRELNRRIEARVALDRRRRERDRDPPGPRPGPGHPSGRRVATFGGCVHTARCTGRGSSRPRLGGLGSTCAMNS